VPPPHLIKQSVLKRYQEEYNLSILVETGTLYGDMLYAMRNCFERLYSIELSEELCEKARKRFSAFSKIEIIHGDSGEQIKHLLPKLAKPTLFWLDGHYSGGITARGSQDTPIFLELTHIFEANRKGDVIIIDDARLFGVDKAYPTISGITEFVHMHRPGAKISVDTDSIRITNF
jgi:hypothetical protein